MALAAADKVAYPAHLQVYSDRIRESASSLCYNLRKFEDFSNFRELLAAEKVLTI